MSEFPTFERIKIINVSKLPSFTRGYIDEITKENRAFYGAVCFVDNKTLKKKGFIICTNATKNLMQRVVKFLSNEIDELNINNPDYPSFTVPK